MSALPKGVVDPNNWNLCPTPIQPCSENDFWREFSMYGTGMRTEFRQVTNLPGYTKGRLESIHIFWYQDHGIAIRVDYSYSARNSKTSWKPQFFRIGCEHKYAEDYRQARNCYREYECLLCGSRNAVDSSG